MQTDKKIQAWCAHVQWQDRAPFIVGTFYVEVGTLSREEIMKLAEQKYKEEWGQCLPVGVPLPDTFKLLPGALFFVPDEDWK